MRGVMAAVLAMGVTLSPAMAQSGAAQSEVAQADPAPADTQRTKTRAEFVPMLPSDANRPWLGPQMREQGGAATKGFVAGAVLSTAAALVKGRKPASGVGPVDPSRPVRAAEAPSSYRAETDSEAAVHACAKAIEAEGRRSFPLAQVGQVHTANPLGNGYDVQGDVLLRVNYREAGVAHGFRCRVDAQAVRMVAIESLQTGPTR
ncbi:hypothetical protein SOM26_10845 [Sphingomonas sp. CFBP8993]|uniref:hypothetical protein n=1 Tax=Sphingomonas sp. CFBP8993 TaxID=3096526 RepID=UPI002A6A8F52|nr:hypothetical protein [Sphingomonas sp. CFBP8993]MDY0959179.1 hypothetical protein [Sphingomonas sp. CFBP8993]